jgi:hypothetical protein
MPHPVQNGMDLPAPASSTAPTAPSTAQPASQNKPLATPLSAPQAQAQAQAPSPGSSSASSSESSGGGTSVGVIVGAAIGGVVVLAVTAGLVFWFVWRPRQRWAAVMDEAGAKKGGKDSDSSSQVRQTVASALPG